MLLLLDNTRRCLLDKQDTHEMKIPILLPLVLWSDYTVSNYFPFYELDCRMQYRDLHVSRPSDRKFLSLREENMHFRFFFALFSYRKSYTSLNRTTFDVLIFWVFCKKRGNQVSDY